jgi:glycosyltransferase involved in cell wall biosynthesis
MTILRVILDEMISSQPAETAGYTEELTRALIRHAPAGAAVAGIIGSSPEPDYDRVNERLPGLSDLFKSALTHQQLIGAWQHGFTRVPSGMLHAPSLFAPLRKHDRVNSRSDQVIVTIHDVDAWTHPESVGSRRASWTKAMATRAYKYADAVVVPTHSIAAQLDEIIGFGDRVRVIGGAANSQLELPLDASERVQRLALPERYVLAHGVSGRGLSLALATLAAENAPSLSLLVTDSDEGLAEAAAAAGLAADRVVGLGHLAQADLAVVLDRATVLLFPALGEGFGMPMLDAFRFAVPVVHSDSPSIVELAGGAGLAAPGEPADLAEALSQVVASTELANQLGILGQDRAGVFTWRAVAEQVWQLHADL